MQRTLAKDTPNKIGEEVMLRGWVQTVRAHGKIAFLDLKDRSGTLQIGAFDPILSQEFASLSQQDAVEIVGKVKKREEKYINKNNPLGKIEIEASKVSVIAKAK